MNLESRLNPAFGKFKMRPKGDEGNYLAISDPALTYFPGTTVPTVGVRRFKQRPDGLFVPAETGRDPWPIDLIKTYVTYSDAAEQPVPAGLVAVAMAGVRRDSFIRGCAYLLGAYEKFGADRADIDRRLAEGLLKDPAKGRVLERIRAGATLIAPQTLLLLIEFALLREADEPDPEIASTHLVILAMALQDELGGGDEIEDERVFAGDTHSRLFRLIVSSHTFGSSEDPSTTIAHHHQRWVALARLHAADSQAIDLYDAFEQATGVGKDDFTTVGLAIWAHCETRDAYPIPAAAFASLEIPRDTIDRSLAMMSATQPEFRRMLTALPEEYRTEWSFDLLRRFPILRLDNGDVLVLSKTLLLERIYGWLPILDVTFGLRQAKRDADAERADSWFRKLCELDARESLLSMAGERYYGEEAIQSAFGTALPNADAAIEYPDAWTVVEIGTHQLTRATVVAGSADALESDLRIGIDGKVRQIDQTIKDLIAGESNLTGRPALARRRYVAVLVLAEGFPVNPMTNLAIRERLAAEGLLTDPRIGSLHVLDQEELDMAEAIAEEGGPSLLELLEQHERSTLATSAFKDWLILGRGGGEGPRRPNRLERARDEAWKPARERLRSENAAAESASVDEPPDGDGADDPGTHADGA